MLRLAALTFKFAEGAKISTTEPVVEILAPSALCSYLREDSDQLSQQGPALIFTFWCTRVKRRYKSC